MIIVSPRLSLVNARLIMMMMVIMMVLMMISNQVMAKQKPEKATGAGTLLFALLVPG